MNYLILVFNVIALLFIFAALYLRSVYKGNKYIKGIPVALVLLIGFINFYLAGQIYWLKHKTPVTYYFANIMFWGTVAALAAGAALYFCQKNIRK